MSEDEVRALVERFYGRLWNEWDDELVESTLSADFRGRGSLGHETVGIPAWRAFRDSVRAGAPDFHHELLDVVVTGNRAAVRLQVSGTHVGDLVGIPPNGRRFSYPATAIATAVGGLLTVAMLVGDLGAIEESD